MNVPSHNFVVTAAFVKVLLCVRVCTSVCAEAVWGVWKRLSYSNNSSWAAVAVRTHAWVHTFDHAHTQDVVCMLTALWAESYNPRNSLQMKINPVCVLFRTIQLHKQSVWFKQNLT